MKILVTGASGFIGRALIPRLIQSGHEIVATSAMQMPKLPGQPFMPLQNLALTRIGAKP